MARRGDAPLGARIRYAVDNALARGLVVLVAWLGLVSLAVVVLAGLAISLFHIPVNGQTDGGLVEGVWASLVRTLDPGTGGNDVGWPFRTVSLLVTLVGIFVVTTLIGLTANAIDRKLADLRRGRSLVVESGHTLVLGWSPKLATILGEFVVANENQTRASVVILADVDKQEMDEAVRRWVPHPGRTRMVCRTGKPFDPVDLALVTPGRAKSVVVLAAEDDPYDAYAVKTVLALLRTDLPETAPLVVEVRDALRAESLRQATSDRVLPVVSSEVLARVTAQVCRQPGLSWVYQELLDFEGDEIYFGTDDRLAGLTFAEALLAYEDSSVIGVRHANGRVELVPPMDLVLRPGDHVVAISADDDTVVLGGAGGPAVTPAAGERPRRHTPDRILVLGWNDMGPGLLRELDAYACPGAAALVVADPEVVPAAPASFDVAALDVAWLPGRTTDEGMLAKLLADRSWEHLVVLCYRGLPPAESDARTLLTLLEVQHVLRGRGEGEPVPTVVAELLDADDVRIAPTTAADDFVVSDRLTSYVLVQLSENAELREVFDELLGAGGAELSIYDATMVAPAGRTTWRALVAGAAAHGDIAIGYRRGGSGGRAPVVVNPPKATELDLAPGDELVVVTATAD
ncbi:MAG TPA: hypothetical protein VFQ85_06840 [Mycobacteriales bacterium]|nr:hypothetical protein [Mycobacteriales bacterium]